MLLKSLFAGIIISFFSITIYAMIPHFDRHHRIATVTFNYPYYGFAYDSNTLAYGDIYVWPSDYQKGDSYYYTWPLSNHDQFPGAVWVEAFNGDAPKNAVIYEDPNSTQLLYYCRVQMNHQLVYGQLVPDRGCVIGGNHSDMISSSYQVLVR